MNGYLEITDNNKLVRKISFFDFEIDYKLRVVKIKNSFTEFLYHYSSIRENIPLTDKTYFYHIVITLDSEHK